ncbi:MAG TPA: murein L,D-transpeptidase family protein [Xanthobacteraceae bacterium]
MKRHPVVRSLLASAVVAAAIALAGCNPESMGASSLRSLQPLSPQMIAEIDHRNMSKDSPILVRIFKEESELEVWKQDNTGRFALLKTYPICRWSGELGPKVRMGDRQAPEGFYTITPGLMNPNSNYYLAINTGFPNAYDRANGHTGEFLMIHGDCSSAGCYAMTDEQVGEIYALARESFLGGQRSFQIQAYPFRMTPLNMARHRNSPNMPFWQMLKEGYDHFEVTRLEPKVDVCEKRYVFDAETKDKFNPAGKCPAYKVDDELAAAVAEKEQNDERQTAELASRGTQTVPVRTGTDGGMNPTFLAAFRPHAPWTTVPGTIPSHARAPGQPYTPPATLAVASSNATSSPSAAASTPVSASREQPSAYAASKEQPSTDQTRSVGLLTHLFGSGATTEPAATEPAAAKPKAKETPKVTQTATASAAKSKPAYELSSSKSAPASVHPHVEAKATPQPAREEGNDEPSPKPANTAGLLNGAQPTLAGGSFDSRWGVFR